MPASIANVNGNLSLTPERIEHLAKYVRPCWDDVVICPSEDSDEIGAGNLKLIRPESTKNPYPTEGIIISTGPEVPTMDIPDPTQEDLKPGEKPQMIEVPVFEPGDRVVFSRYTGIKMNFGDSETLLLLPARDIRGVMDPECPVLGKEKPPTFVPR